MSKSKGALKNYTMEELMSMSPRSRDRIWLEMHGGSGNRKPSADTRKPEPQDRQDRPRPIRTSGLESPREATTAARRPSRGGDGNQPPPPPEQRRSAWVSEEDAHVPSPLPEGRPSNPPVGKVRRPPAVSRQEQRPSVSRQEQRPPVSSRQARRHPIDDDEDDGEFMETQMVLNKPERVRAKHSTAAPWAVEAEVPNPDDDDGACGSGAQDAFSDEEEEFPELAMMRGQATTVTSSSGGGGRGDKKVEAWAGATPTKKAQAASGKSDFRRGPGTRQDGLTVTVKMMDGRTVSVRPSADDSISDLRAALKEKLGIPKKETVHILFEGRLLEGSSGAKGLDGGDLRCGTTNELIHTLETRQRFQRKRVAELDALLKDADAELYRLQRQQIDDIPPKGRQRPGGRPAVAAKPDWWG
eukprot:Rmarinus@m.5939